MQLIDGKAIAAQIKKEIAEEVSVIKAKGGKTPHLAAVLVGHDGGSETYVSNKVRTCEEVGFKSTLIRYENDVTEEEILACVERLNNDADIDGFIVQLPLPKHISEEKVITNDIVEILNERQFKWLGRYDNVINSGGIKLFPEQIETKLASKIKNRFFITSQPDAVLGSKVVLVIEGEKRDIDSSIFNSLEKFERPKEILFVTEFVETETKKINRIKTLNFSK